MNIPNKPVRIKNASKLQRTGKVQFTSLDEVPSLNKEGDAMKHTFRVRGRSNAFYTVTHQENEWNCNCPDFQHRGCWPGQICKHIMAVIVEMALDEVTPGKNQVVFGTSEEAMAREETESKNIVPEKVENTPKEVGQEASK